MHGTAEFFLQLSIILVERRYTQLFALKSVEHA